MKNHRQKTLIFLVFLVFLFLIIVPPLFASTTDGMIDSNYKYAYGENVGFINFGSTAGAVHITDSALSGSAYGENIGWINLATVTNNNEGTLSGYAWGENVGFIDFSKVTIGTDGVFSGSAYGENIGWITFGTTNNKVQTDWRPSSSRPGHTSTGSSAQSRYNNLISIGNTKVAEDLKKEFPNYITSSIPNIILNKTSNTAGTTTLRTLKITIPMIKGDDVKALQSYLNEKIKTTLVIDGLFGTKTREAVILFQMTNNLKPDGIVGFMTRSKMN